VELNGITGKYDPTIAGNSVDISAYSLDALWVPARLACLAFPAPRRRVYR